MQTSIHSACSQIGCKVAQLSLLATVPAPKFWIGQRIRLPCVPEDGGASIEYQGVIVGLCHRLDESSYSWVYWVTWDVMPRHGLVRPAPL
jgi:hypothetical protein